MSGYIGAIFSGPGIPDAFQNGLRCFVARLVSLDAIAIVHGPKIFEPRSPRAATLAVSRRVLSD
jgi:hypothetical protein